MTDFEKLLATLARHEVAFIVVGGAAAIAHGSARLTQDLDIRTTLANGLNFTLVTSLGDIDLLGEIPGGGAYEDLAPDAIELHLFRLHCLCLSLTQLIRAKRAAGRPKDLEALAELEAIQEEGP